MLSSLCSIGWIAAWLTACAGAPVGPAMVGYVEGENVLMAPLEVARVTTIPIRKGQRLDQGAVAVTLERADAELAVADAAAKLGQARAELANLKRGKRPEEIAVIAASLNSAQAQARDAERALARRQELFERGNTSRADLDQAITNRDVTEARVRELEANLAVARLPARADEVVAAENRVAQTEAALERARWSLDQRTLMTPAAGRVVDVLRRAGEVAGPTAPVISFLPDGATKIKIYVPEPELARAVIGRRLALACDGCGDGAGATITHVSPDPEFTPPVIYSVEARRKLVYLVEARPDASAARLQPGQIVDARFVVGEGGS